MEADLRAVSAALPDAQALSGRRVVVSGAGGFLGAWLVRSLLALHRHGKVEQPVRVLGMVRNAAKAQRVFGDLLGADTCLDLMAWDFNQIAVPHWGQPVHHVIHAASQASPRFYAQDPVGTLMPNAVGTAALLEAATRAQAESFLMVSSSEVYGAVSGQNALRESDGGYVDPASVRSCYAESKRLAETLCVAWHAQHGLRTTIVRPFHTYGPGLTRDDGRVFADFAFAVAEGRPIVMTSDGSARRAFCYASDAVAGMLTVLLQGQAATPYNLANPQAELSVRELAELLIGLYPERGSRLEQRPPPGGYLPSPFNRLVPDISRLQALGWTPQVGAAEGFRRFIEAIKP
jgi:UDP-glucuronate decarboxylase